MRRAAGVFAFILSGVSTSAPALTLDLYPAQLWGIRAYANGATCGLWSSEKIGEPQHNVEVVIEWPDGAKLIAWQTVTAKSWTAPSNPEGDASTVKQLCSLTIESLSKITPPKEPIGGLPPGAVKWQPFVDKYGPDRPSIDKYSVQWSPKTSCNGEVDMERTPNLIQIHLYTDAATYSVMLPAKSSLTTPEAKRRAGMKGACLATWTDRQQRVLELR